MSDTPDVPSQGTQSPNPPQANMAAPDSHPSQPQAPQQGYPKPYKHHAAGQGPQGQGPHNPSRQNQQGYQNNKYYNKQRNYNQKGAKPQYAGGYSFNPQMYNGNYFYSYPYAAQGMVAGMNGIPAYPPQLPQPQHLTPQQYPASPSAAKVIITDREGKQVDLEEKKLSASSSAASTPAPVAAQMVAPSTLDSASAKSASSSPAAESTPSPQPAAESATNKASVADEFRRKIAERAKLAKQKKEEAEREAEQAKAAAEKERLAKLAPPAPVEEPKPAEPEPVAAPEPVPEPKSAEEPKEEPVESVETPETKEAEVAKELTEEPAEEVPEESTKETTQEPIEEPAEKSPAPESETPADLTNEDITEDKIDEDSQEDDQEDESVFDLSQYFNRLATAEPIDDPFSFLYPYPLTGPDTRWKTGAKKYRYDPQFLLQFRDVVQYPIDDAWKEKLEGLGIVPNKKSSGGPQRMNSNKFGSQMQGGRFNGSMPGRLGQFDGRQNSRSGSKKRGGSSVGGSRDKSMRNRNQSKRGGPREKDEEPSKPAEDVAPLVPSANRWVPRSRAKKEEVKLAPDGSVLLDTEDIERKVKSALNKLTLEMFEPITEDLLKIAKQSVWEDNAQTIKQVISLTFAKACDEPYWSSVYAQFCAKMLKEVPEEVKDVNTLTKSGEPATGGDLARRLLLATCQVEYEKGWVDKLPTNEDGSPLEPEMMSDEYYAMAAAKRRGLGLVKFIGNLYILNMLNDQVILHCLRDQSKNVQDPSEDSLENLAQLIKTVGPRFEASDRNKAALTLVYDNIQQILDNCKLSSRIKFMLMDLQDLRRSNWKSIKQDAGPKTIKEIHNEAELKRIEDSRAQAEKRRQNKGGYNNSGYGGGDSRSNSTRGGSSWGNKKESRAPTKDARGFTSVSRNQSNRPGMDNNASQLPPRENSKRTDSMASNIFAALGGDNDDDESEAH